MKVFVCVLALVSVASAGVLSGVLPGISHSEELRLLQLVGGGAGTAAVAAAPSQYVLGNDGLGSTILSGGGLGSTILSSGGLGSTVLRSAGLGNAVIAGPGLGGAAGLLGLGGQTVSVIQEGAAIAAPAPVVRVIQAAQAPVQTVRIIQEHAPAPVENIQTIRIIQESAAHSEPAPARAPAHHAPEPAAFPEASVNELSIGGGSAGGYNYNGPARNYRRLRTN